LLMLCPLFLSLLPWVHRAVPLLRPCFHLSLCVIMFVFVYMFIFGSIFHIQEKRCGLCLWNWVTSQNLSYFCLLRAQHIWGPCYVSFLCRTGRIPSSVIGISGCFLLGLGDGRHPKLLDAGCVCCVPWTSGFSVTL
jgi:hypothetical protein